MIVAEKRLKTDSRVQVTVGVAFERSTTNGRIGTSVTAMGVNNPDRSPLGIHGRDAAPSNRPALSRACVTRSGLGPTWLRFPRAPFGVFATALWRGLSLSR